MRNTCRGHLPPACCHLPALWVRFLVSGYLAPACWIGCLPTTRSTCLAPACRSVLHRAWIALRFCPPGFWILQFYPACCLLPFRFTCSRFACVSTCHLQIRFPAVSLFCVSHLRFCAFSAPLVFCRHLPVATAMPAFLRLPACLLPPPAASRLPFCHNAYTVLTLVTCSACGFMNRLAMPTCCVRSAVCRFLTCGSCRSACLLFTCRRFTTCSLDSCCRSAIPADSAGFCVHRFCSAVFCVSFCLVLWIFLPCTAPAYLLRRRFSLPPAAVYCLPACIAYLHRSGFLPAACRSPFWIHLRSILLECRLPAFAQPAVAHRSAVRSCRRRLEHLRFTACCTCATCTPLRTTAAVTLRSVRSLDGSFVLDHAWVYRRSPLLCRSAVHLPAVFYWVYRLPALPAPPPPTWF